MSFMFDNAALTLLGFILSSATSGGLPDGQQWPQERQHTVVLGTGAFSNRAAGPQHPPIQTTALESDRNADLQA